MLFNLTKERNFKNKGIGKEIACYENYGPVFCDGNSSDLGVTALPFNGRGNCYSFVNNPGYGIPEEDGKNMLTT
jgi:hypothetical protein